MSTSPVVESLEALLAVHSIPSRGSEPGHLHLDVRFLVVTDRPEALQASTAESAEVRWFTFEEALHRSGTTEMRRLLVKARTALAVPQ
jgi:hypothetical protein